MLVLTGCEKLLLTFVIILGVLVFAFFIGIIAIAVNSTKDPLPLIYFTEYYAEIEEERYPGGSRSAIARKFLSKHYMFNTNKWSVDYYFKGIVTSRMFSTERNDYITRCMKVGDHDNCYVETSSSFNYFDVPGTAEVKKEVDCSLYAKKAGRNVSTCDLYTYITGGESHQLYVEESTNYPVFDKIYADDGSSSMLTARYYKVFKVGPPNDESVLKPFSDVTIYDFRTGKGDSGDGESNVFTKDTAKRSFVQYDDPLDEIKEAIKDIEKYGPIRQTPSMGLLAEHVIRGYKASTRDTDAAIPASFDARENWKNCTSIIGTIQTQGGCGSCWAVSSSSVLSDRYCIRGIASHLSSQYLINCGKNNNGCSGGNTDEAWTDIMEIGLPPESCVSYAGADEPCLAFCDDGTPITDSMKVKPIGYNVPWGKTSAERVQAIQREIMTNGPVQASLIVFSDFYSFFVSTTGIYHRSKDARRDDGHAVRIIGWGSESGVDYWLVANSWGTDFPNKGVFRIRRGNNECNIEEEVAGGIFA